jgi:hypothetical protein
MFNDRVLKERDRLCGAEFDRTEFYAGGKSCLLKLTAHRKQNTLSLDDNPWSKPLTRDADKFAYAALHALYYLPLERDDIVRDEV